MVNLDWWSTRERSAWKHHYGRTAIDWSMQNEVFCRHCISVHVLVAVESGVRCAMQHGSQTRSCAIKINFQPLHP